LHFINFDEGIFTYFCGQHMSTTPRYSVIIPVYNRPDELRELLQSLTEQSYKNFEVIVVEDGSANRCDHVVDAFRERLDIHYLFKPNTGPGPSRNMGFSHARGEYFVAFDSDCIIPPHYFGAVESRFASGTFDAWGGPDRSHESFTPLQQAMAYTMSSPITTGGIRGGEKHLGWFQPRSFNMGISRQVFMKTKGFAFHRLAEDIELSVRMKREGFRSVLITEAFVYHKRRNTLSQFFRQVSDFGRGRVQVGRLYPDEVRLVHWLPTLFTVGLVLLVLIWPFSKVLLSFGLLCYMVFPVVIFADSFRSNRNILVAALSVIAAFVQLLGYGSGFLLEQFKR
jgi:glycosyltransferase involved in cell wall biosynthesis